MIDRYDIGFINDFGGGDTNWWADYLRAEVERANDFHADIHEQTAARIAALEAENKALQHDLNGAKGNVKNLLPTVAYWKAQTKRLEAENERLRKALEPFANAADIKLCGDWRDDERFAQTDVGHYLTFGHLRAARAALEAKP